MPVLDWTNRVKIAAGAARGIAYLHEDCNPRIIHRDIKSANILLDYNFEARVSDFGLAKLAVDANSHVTTRIVGTFGYVAPEYVSSGKLTEKSDVYSFGVMLLELITGRKPVDVSQPVGEESLVEWARPLLSEALDSEEFESLTDPNLGKNYVESEMICMVEVAAACVRYSSARRPRMGQVVRAFDGLATCDLSNGMRCLLLQILVLVLLKLPWKVIRKTREYAKKKLRQRKGNDDRGKKKKKKKIELGSYEDVLVRIHEQSFRVQGEMALRDGEGLSFSGCMDEVEKVMEEFYEKGEFGFGNFWGREGACGCGVPPTIINEHHIDANFVRYQILDLVGSLNYAETCNINGSDAALKDSFRRIS
ncbi:unnamed protein product [Sphenostylis stenocarpa]|uniref:non-specific serine/threonine protein kinase n=1 Tax=Sphenostylis stenocarpa TaxID=92480 RepID=A0AA86VGI0_9FABA|nr:unnamed protein product [Sphenostylis stenocarpa]